MKIIPRIHTRKGKVIHESVNAFFEKKVFIPLAQEENFSPICLVKKGDVVREGDVIAENKNFSDTSLHTKLHASFPGTVEEVSSAFSPDGKKSDCVSIRLHGSFSYSKKKQIAVSFDTFQSELLPAKIATLGILNTFETLHPRSLANDIAFAKKSAHRILFVRLFDDDPDRLTDSLLFEIFPKKIQNGANILAQALYADAIIFAIDEKKLREKKLSKQNSIDKNFRDKNSNNKKSNEKNSVKQNFVQENSIDKNAIETKFTFSVPHIFLPVNIEKYPNGFKEELLALSKKKLRDEPFSFVNDKSLFVDSTTLVAVSNAIEKNEPCIESYVYVSGDCIPTSALLKVRLGTTMKHLAEQCGGLKKDVGMIVVNGSLLGTLSRSLEAGITKYVKSVIFLSKKHVALQCLDTCNDCKKCRDACPRNLSPDILWREATSGKNYESEFAKSSKLCSACALCNFVCPSRLPLCQSVQILKSTVQKENHQ